VLVVLGHRQAEIAAELADNGVTLVENPRYAEGMLSSVRAGISAAPPDAEWLVLALGDQPSLRPETVTRLLAAAREGPETIVVPSYGGRRGHPLVFHARYRAEILALAGDRGLKELLQRHPTAIRHVLFEDEAVLADMDTPEDYRRELKRLEPPAVG
jgi:molybdenum cofactor cytidylyltransferase